MQEGLDFPKRARYTYPCFLRVQQKFIIRQKGGGQNDHHSENTYESCFREPVRIEPASWELSVRIRPGLIWRAYVFVTAQRLRPAPEALFLFSGLADGSLRPEETGGERKPAPGEKTEEEIA